MRTGWPLDRGWPFLLVHRRTNRPVSHEQRHGDFDFSLYLDFQEGGYFKIGEKIAVLPNWLIDRIAKKNYFYVPYMCVSRESCNWPWVASRLINGSFQTAYAKSPPMCNHWRAGSTG